MTAAHQVTGYCRRRPQMKILEVKSLAIEDVKVIKYARFGDHRGYFTEIFNAAIAYELIFGIADAGNKDGLALFASPNPFLTETTIHFKISGKQNANLTLFDISGKAVKTLWSGNQAGDHTFRVSGKELSAGTYFVKLSGQGSGRMIRVIHRN